jgi:succinyl-CoA synthetase beta subunit
MLSAQGGVEIEVVAEENPDAIAFLSIDPVRGLDVETARVAGSPTPNSTTSRASRPPNYW